MARAPKIQREHEAEFAVMWNTPTTKAQAIANHFGLSLCSVFNTARRLNLPRRMPVLERLGLPPFGRRRGECAA